MYRIDAWIIERIYQQIVDWSQRKPAWFGRQVAIAQIIVVLLQPLFIPSFGMYTVALGLLAAGLCFYWARNDATFATNGRLGRWVGLRLFMLTLVFVGPIADVHPATNLRSLLCVSWFYFSACRPPKPREPKHRLASAGVP